MLSACRTCAFVFQKRRWGSSRIRNEKPACGLRPATLTYHGQLADVLGLAAPGYRYLVITGLFGQLPPACTSPNAVWTLEQQKFEMATVPGPEHG